MLYVAVIETEGKFVNLMAEMIILMTLESQMGTKTELEKER